MTVNLFDANFYRAANSDLAGFNDSQAWSHFQNYGLNEGRLFNPLVDLSVYRSSNSDLANFSNRQLYEHLSNYGVAEGRCFSDLTDLSFYRTNNADLAGFNNEQLFSHLQSYGVAEGRIFSPYADLGFYLSANRDLGQAFGSNRQQALYHLVTYGLNENRNYSQFFNQSYYAAENPDLVTAGLRGSQFLQHFVTNGLAEGRDFSEHFELGYYNFVNLDLNAAGLTLQQLYQHFQTNGLNEGRASSVFFDVSYYLTNNPDLRAAGLNNRQAFDHFLINGINEGRLGSDFSLLTGNEIAPEINVGNGNITINGNVTINGSLTTSDRPNPTRSGAYSDDYRLSGFQVGQQILFNLNAVANRFDTYLQIVNAATGAVVDYNDDANGTLNSQLQFTAQAGTEYIVRVTSYNANSTGDYTLTAAPQSTLAGSISGNQSLSGSLVSTDFVNPSRSGTYRDDYSLTGVSAGQQVRINLDSTAFDTYLQLVNANTGEVLSFNDDANGSLNSEVSFTAQAAINYIVRVTSYRGSATGNYSLRTVTTGAAIGANQSISGSLDSTDPTNPLRNGTYRDDYRLTGATAGQQIRINLNSSNFDTYLQLVNEANGQVISFNDDANGSLNSELSFSVQSGVNYIVRVTSYGSNSTGAYSLSTSAASGGDWISTNITDAGLQTIIRNRSADGILDRNDMLAIFRDGGLTDGGIIDAAEQTSLRTLVTNGSRFRVPDYVQFLSQRVTDSIFTNMSVSQFDSSLVGRWFLGTVAPTPQFNSTTLTYVQVQGNLYGSSGRPVIGDIDQRRFGDCAFLAALGATFAPQSSDAGNQRSAVIESMIIDNGDNTYTVRFYDGSTPQWVSVDRRVPFGNGSWYGAAANGSTDPNNSNNVLWAPLVERAYAQWREWREGQPGYNLIGNGDNLVRPLQFVTGRTATNYSTSSITFATIQTALSSGRAVETGRLGANSTYIVGGHAYSVTNAYVSNGQQRITVRNPWGRDGLTPSGDANDGFIDMSFSEFVSNFNYGVAIA